MNARRPLRTLAATIAAASVVLLGFAACSDPVAQRSPTAAVGSGDPGVGRDLAVQYGCGSCHQIPGVPNARAMVGPPLDSWSQRAFIAGTLTNTAENLARWIEDPQAIRPGSAMPALGISPEDASHLAAYLLTLR